MEIGGKIHEIKCVVLLNNTSYYLLGFSDITVSESQDFCLSSESSIKNSSRVNMKRSRVRSSESEALLGLAPSQCILAPKSYLT